MKFDYIIVGAGLFGSVVAERLVSAGKSVLVFDERDHIGGSCYSEIDPSSNIIIHKYGMRIFHTNDKDVWNYITKFSEFNQYRHSVYAITREEHPIPLPFNLNTIYSIYGSLDNIDEKLKQDGVGSYSNPANLREQAINSVGREIYELLIRDYTIKHWDIDPSKLPAEIIKRLPIRRTLDNSYFSDRYQGCPINGYTPIFEKMLKNSNVILGNKITDLNKLISLSEMIAHDGKIIYTGCLDQLIYPNESELSKQLKWRTTKHDTLFLHKLHGKEENFYCQGAAAYNYTVNNVHPFPEELNHIFSCESTGDANTNLRPITRVFEYKHINPERMVCQTKTIIQREWTVDGKPEKIRDYPIPIKEEINKHKELKELIYQIFKGRVVVGGRLGDYQYYNMDTIIRKALDLSETLLGRQ